jgi:membrane protein DedA with SNARE-associated domain
MLADHHVLPLILQYGLLVAVLLVLVGQLGVPTGVPAELVLAIVGGYAVHSFGALLGALCLLAAADVLGSVTLFLLARRGGAGLAARFAGRLPGGVDPALPRWPHRLRSRRAVFLVRALPLVRIYGPVGSGLLRTRTRDYLAGAVPAGLVWVGVPLALGFLLRGQLAEIAVAFPAEILSVAAVVPGLLMTVVVLRRLRGPISSGARSPLGPARTPPRVRRG